MHTTMAVGRATSTAWPAWSTVRPPPERPRAAPASPPAARPRTLDVPRATLIRFAESYLEAESLAEASVQHGLRVDVGAACLAWLGAASRQQLVALRAGAAPQVQAFTVWRVRGFVDRRTSATYSAYVAQANGLVDISVEGGAPEVEATRLAAALGAAWPGAKLLRGDRQKRDGSEAEATSLDRHPRLAWVTEEVLGCHVARETLLAGLLLRALLHNVVDGRALPPGLTLGLVPPGLTVGSVVDALLEGRALAGAAGRPGRTTTSPALPVTEVPPQGPPPRAARESTDSRRARVPQAPRPRTALTAPNGTTAASGLSAEPATWQRAAALFRRNLQELRIADRAAVKRRTPYYRPPLEVRARAAAIAIAAMSPPHNVRRRVVARHMGISKETLLRYLREVAPTFVDNLSVLELELVVPALREIAMRVGAPGSDAAGAATGLPPATPAPPPLSASPPATAAQRVDAPTLDAELQGLLDVVKRALRRRERRPKSEPSAAAQLRFDWPGGERSAEREGAKA